MIVQRHYTWQPYNMMLFWYSAAGQSLPPPIGLFVCFVFRGIPLGSVIVICCLRQSQRKSLGLLVPRLLDDINVPYLVKNTPKTNNYPQNSRRDESAKMRSYKQSSTEALSHEQNNLKWLNESFMMVGASRSVSLYHTWPPEGDRDAVRLSYCFCALYNLIKPHLCRLS